MKRGKLNNKAQGGGGEYWIIIVVLIVLVVLVFSVIIASRGESSFWDNIKGVLSGNTNANGVKNGCIAKCNSMDPSYNTEDAAYYYTEGKTKKYTHGSCKILEAAQTAGCIGWDFKAIANVPGATDVEKQTNCKKGVEWKAIAGAAAETCVFVADNTKAITVANKDQCLVYWTDGTPALIDDTCTKI